MGIETRSEDDISAAAANIVLCCVSGTRLSAHVKNYTQPGVHANCFIHGLLGFFHSQSDKISRDLSDAFVISTVATRYLALPCLMADLYSADRNMSAAHLISGLIPFVLALAGKEHQKLGNIVIAGNLISLCVYSHRRDRIWGLYAAGAGFLAYFLTPDSGIQIAYPLFLSLFNYCASNIYS
ncbi:uncharacterized protein LOC121737675 [Aricia agestis]|uniref:uncharacterized protein LOC121737675 n=1 Tax=Aricia agestis TaxID=91739 RepID=UPI001C20AEC6|nr:uncharacterized protein LOC121737675 [Aricia agestis]